LGGGFPDVRRSPTRSDRPARGCRPAVPERRHRDRIDRDAVIEIRTELPLVEQDLQVAVRGGDDAGVDLDASFVSDPTDFVFLEGAEHFDLEGRAHLGHFVQE
jgi:hypothetical protein